MHHQGFWNDFRVGGVRWRVVACARHARVVRGACSGGARGVCGACVRRAACFLFGGAF